DPTLASATHGMFVGLILLFLGQFPAAQRHFEESIPRCDPEKIAALRFLFGNDNRMGSISAHAVVLAYLGYADQALGRTRDALTLTRESDHPSSIAYAHLYAAWVHQLRGEPGAVREHAEALIALSIDQSLTQRLAQAHALRGWALAAQGHEDGIAELDQAL